MEKFGTARQVTVGNIIRRMRIACWITKATNTHSEYVILVAFPLQKWLRKRVSMLRYTYIAAAVNLSKGRSCVASKKCTIFEVGRNREQFIEIMNLFVNMEVFIAVEISYRLRNIKEAE